MPGPFRWESIALPHFVPNAHFWPGSDRERSRESAGDVFDKEILLADEGLAVALD